MKYEDRVYHTNRILFCRTFFHHGNRAYYVGVPEPMNRLRAEILYKESIDESIWSDQDRLHYLNRICYWGTQDEEKITTLKKEIDDCKIDLYNSGFKRALGERIRETILNKYKELKSLTDKRALYEDTTRESIANQCRFKFVVASSLRMENNTYLYQNPLKLRDFTLINVAISSLLNDSLNEMAIRNIARSEPWSSIWSSSDKCFSLFNCNAADLTDEQKILIYWSQLYDNIRANTELDEDVIGDDWKMDGFLIQRRREREKDNLRKSVGAKISPAVAQGDNIFIIAENQQESEAIDSLNDAGAKMIKAQMQHEIYNKGTLRYQDSTQGKEQIAKTLHEKRKR